MEIARDVDVQGPDGTLVIRHAHSYTTDSLHFYYVLATSPKIGRITSSFPALVAEDLDKARGERIEDLMTAQGWNPTHLARVIRVDRSLIYDWKDGRRVSSEALERLVLALGTSRRYIETGEGEPFVPRDEAPAILIKQLADALAERDPQG